MGLVVGQTVGRFRVDALVGRGGMGEVFRGHDVELGRTVAIKAIREDVATDEAEHLERVSRFAREARLSARFLHPNFCALYDVAEHDGRTFLVMEWIDGVTLKKAMLDPTVPLDRRLEWMTVLARALGDAHEANIVHRDFKPSNVMLAQDGTLKILDFGLAVTAVTETAAAGDYRTLTGSVLGTDRYMAPEQMAGARVDGRADQFAWAVVAYELLGRVHPANAGEPSFPAAPPKPLDVVEPRVPAPFARAVMRALRALPSERFASMRELATALEERPSPAAPPGTRSPRRRTLFVASGLAGFALAALALSALLATRRGSPDPSPALPLASTPPHELPAVDAADDVGPTSPTDEVPPEFASPDETPHELVDAATKVRPRPLAPAWRVVGDAGGNLADRRPVPPEPPPGPRVVYATGSEAYASGYLPAELMPVAQSLVPALTRCFNVPGHPSGDHDLSVSVVVEEDGHVTGTTVLSAIEAGAKPCVKSAVMTARFPFHPRSRPTSVRLDFALRPVTPP